MMDVLLLVKVYINYIYENIFFLPIQENTESMFPTMVIWDPWIQQRGGLQLCVRKVNVTCLDCFMGLIVNYFWNLKITMGFILARRPHGDEKLEMHPCTRYQLGTIFWNPKYFNLECVPLVFLHVLHGRGYFLKNLIASYLNVRATIALVKLE